MTQITFPDDVTGAIQITHGSSGRLNVSARADERIFYSSRDDGQAYLWKSVDGAAAAGEYTLYIKNLSTSKNLIIKDITFSPGVDMTFKIATVTGTAGGTGITGFNLNQNSGNAADVSAFGDAAVTGLTEATVIHNVQVLALTTVTIDFHDALILGQNNNIAIECDVNAGGVVNLMVFGHLE